MLRRPPLGPPAALAAKRSTQAIPIVFVSGGDPVQMGLVSSFHRPDGNVTGFYFLATELVAKRLALLRELLPRAKRVAVLVNPTNVATADPTTRGVAVAGRALSFDIQVFNASTSQEVIWGTRLDFIVPGKFDLRTLSADVIPSTALLWRAGIGAVKIRGENCLARCRRE